MVPRGICATSCWAWCAHGRLLRIGAPEVDAIEATDRLLYIRNAGHYVDFQLRSVPLLSRVGADRADQLRTDVTPAAIGWADAALLRVDSRNQVLVANGRVVLGAAADLADEPPPSAVFLGRIEGGRHVWAIRGALEAPEDPDAQAEVVDVRSLGPHLRRHQQPTHVFGCGAVELA